MDGDTVAQAPPATAIAHMPHKPSVADTSLIPMLKRKVTRCFFEGMVDRREMVGPGQGWMNTERWFQ